MPIPKDQTFFAFFNLDDAYVEEDFERDEREEPEDDPEMKGLNIDDQDPEMEETIRNLENFNQLKIGYITFSTKGY